MDIKSIEIFKKEYPFHKNTDVVWREKFGIKSYRQCQRWGGKYNLNKDSSFFSTFTTK
jgi:hypothetical protein